MNRESHKSENELNSKWNRKALRSINQMESQLGDALISQMEFCDIFSSPSGPLSFAFVVDSISLARMIHWLSSMIYARNSFDDHQFSVLRVHRYRPSAVQVEQNRQEETAKNWRKPESRGAKSETFCWPRKVDVK